MMLIQLVHKTVREIPCSIAIGMPAGTVYTAVLAGLLAVGIGLLLARKVKPGLLAGTICACAIVIQPIVVHGIMAKPDINGVWWYPIFPATQGTLIMYFCVLTWKKSNRPGGSEANCTGLRVTPGPRGEPT